MITPNQNSKNTQIKNKKQIKLLNHILNTHTHARTHTLFSTLLNEKIHIVFYSFLPSSLILKNPLWKGLVPFLCTRVRTFMCMPVTLVVPYMLTGFAGCSVGRGISRGVCKLARTPT